MEAFDADGWFRTGDIAKEDNGTYTILGRENVDIIKSAGYKMSALEIERVFMQMEDIAEIAVVGVSSSYFGQCVAAVIVLRERKCSDESFLSELRSFGSHRLAPYKLPTMVKVLEVLPKNVMGKVNKKSLLGLFGNSE